MVSILPVERRVEPNPQRSGDAPRQPSPVSETTPASRPGQPVVLIVDDDPTVRAVVEMNQARLFSVSCDDAPPSGKSTTLAPSQPVIDAQEPPRK